MVGKDRRRNIVLIVKRVGNEENHVENAGVAEKEAAQIDAGNVDK